MPLTVRLQANTARSEQLRQRQRQRKHAVGFDRSSAERMTADKMRRQRERAAAALHCSTGNVNTRAEKRRTASVSLENSLFSRPKCRRGTSRCQFLRQKQPPGLSDGSVQWLGIYATGAVREQNCCQCAAVCDAERRPSGKIGLAVCVVQQGVIRTAQRPAQQQSSRQHGQCVGLPGHCARAVHPSGRTERFDLRAQSRIRRRPVLNIRIIQPHSATAFLRVAGMVSLSRIISGFPRICILCVCAQRQKNSGRIFPPDRFRLLFPFLSCYNTITAYPMRAHFISWRHAGAADPTTHFP